MKNFRVAFFDIDGTLVDNQLPHTLPFGERIPASAKLALRKLKENQIEPVIASGRNHQTLAALAEELGVDSIISSNGNCVHYQGKIIHQNSIPNDLLKKLIAHLEQEEIAYLIETADLIYSYEDEQQNEKHPSKKALLQQSDPLPENVLQLIVGWNERTDFKLGIDSPLIAEKVAPVAANIHLKTGTKAEGIHKICAEMAITADQALAFGDEENDFTMFDAVGFPVAMGNAAPALKEKAAHVTAPVSNDGIWKACVELGLIAE
ncbi:Cof-type HAD-IIB family hydrolase [Enterococcus devriesei]|uniref:Cof-type HAD-IIB family hydrolase n=1 Tax=Enterococcus devriesei TaxID=319970 RepID=UPI0028A8A517|nr:Cof-type HAD-IIB family hydrolase [Enterococcus devriesei]